jgi:DNA repair protein RadD
MILLRPYQKRLIEEASARFREGRRRVLVQAPAASGKTVVVSHMMGTAATRGFPSIFVVHRRELLNQASDAFTANGVRHGIIAAGSASDPDQLVQVATIGALARKTPAVHRRSHIVEMTSSSGNNS